MPHSWETVVSLVGAGVLDDPFGVALQGPEKLVDNALSWMVDLEFSSPGDLVTLTLTSSAQSLLQSRKPKQLSREEVAALFVSQPGGDLLKSNNWSPELQLAVEKAVDSVLAASGFSVAEVLLMNFAGYMASKNKHFSATVCQS